MALRPAILLAFLLALPAWSQDEQDPTLVEHTKIVSVKVEPATVAPGDTFHAVFQVRIDPEWHIYSANGTYGPTDWKFEGPVERAGKIDEPAPKHHREVVGKDEKGKELLVEYDYHEGELTFRVPLRLAATAGAGPLKLAGKMTGTECDPRICITFDLAFAADLTVAGEKKAGVTTPPPDEAHTKIVSVAAEPPSVKVGETFHLVFKVAIEPTWHIYSVTSEGNGTAWEFDAGMPVESAGKAVESKSKRGRLSLGKDDEGKEEFLEYDYHSGEATFRVPVRLTPAAKPGPLRLKGRMLVQECDPKVCIQRDVPFDMAVTVLDGAVAPASGMGPSQDTEDGAQKAAQEEFEKRGLIGFLLLAMGGGLISLLMPCTYPMLPITLTYFLKQGGESRARGALLASAYSVGLVLSFTIIGLILSLILGEDGPRRLAANPWANLTIGAVFLYFAFSLFGLYEIALPSFITGSVSSGPRSGVGGAFVLGSLFAVVTFTCTIPIAGAVLGLTASSGVAFRFIGVAAMFVYALTMAIPFFIMGLFPSMLKSVPRSGGWLHTVKVTTAFGELALALAYIAKADVVWEIGVLSRPVMVSIWVATLAFMSLYLLGVFRLKGDMPPPHLGITRLMFSMVFGILSIYLGFSVGPAGVFDTVLPPDVAPAQSRVETKERVHFNLDAAMEEAKKTGKPVFVEFTGAT